jgi:hypothetical protein
VDKYTTDRKKRPYQDVGWVNCIEWKCSFLLKPGLTKKDLKLVFAA